MKHHLHSAPAGLNCQALVGRKELNKLSWRDFLQNIPLAHLATCECRETPRKDEGQFQIQGFKESGQPGEMSDPGPDPESEK